MQVLEPVLAVEAVEKARKRIPEYMKPTHPYSSQALWTFYLRTLREPVGESCPYCEMFDGQTFTGSQLRSVFPDHKWVGDDIYPNVHMTLWGKDTCACLLIREPAEARELNLDMWSQMGVDWKKQFVESNEEEE
jgi:hypothetical protein